MKLPIDTLNKYSEPVLLGIDIGGTKILGGLVSMDGKVLFEIRIATRRTHLLEDIVTMARTILKEAGSSAIGLGVGTTGFVDYEAGLLVQSMNMGIQDVAIAETLRAETDLPIRVDNDVHAATVGEIHFGIGRTHRDFLLYNAGTGLATGMVFDGRLHRGASNAAGENGHISMQQGDAHICACGLNGCVEHLLLQARAGVDTPPAYLPNIEPPESILYGYLALNITQLVNLINPSAVVLAGGMFTGDPDATKWVCHAVQKHALPNAVKALKETSLARSAPYAGLIGAAALTIPEKSPLPTEVL